jgi:predicted AAA+ superfamily ATPase
MKERTLQHHIEQNLFRNKIVILFGTRRTGKTTLAKQILEKYSSAGKRCRYFNCELLELRNQIETTSIGRLGDFLRPYDFIVLDDVQHMENIGLSLKIMVDTYPEVQIMATGSSSFDIANKTGEPLVGRSRQYTLLPFSLGELNCDLFDLETNLENFLRFGMYPTVVFEENPIEELNHLVSGYLYKDILALEGIKHSKTILNLLRLLALQIGSEVSYNEIASKLGISIATVVKYIDLLEKCFIIFVLPAFSRNLRNEVGLRSRKIYFYDLGIRNTLVNAFAPLDTRSDLGALWENFCITELMKKANNNRKFSNNYFWRTYDQQEIDYIEERDGLLQAYEFKYNSKARVKPSRLFMETYKSEFCVVHRDNWYEKLVG